MSSLRHPDLPPAWRTAFEQGLIGITIEIGAVLDSGSTLEDVKNQLGNSSAVLTSNTYGHVLEQRQRQVARAMDAVLGG